MTRQPAAFRSRSDLEKETKLLQHYKQIGIGSIAAAASAIRRRQPPVPTLKARPQFRAAD